MSLGENPDTMFADWLLDRFAGKPARSGVRSIDTNGTSRFQPGEAHAPCGAGP